VRLSFVPRELKNLKEPHPFEFVTLLLSDMDLRGDFLDVLEVQVDPFLDLGL
jgi:hypothetical protein